MISSPGADAIWVGVSNIESGLAFFRDYVGMSVESDRPLPRELVEGLWGCPSGTATRAVTLQNTNQKTLLRLVEFRPGASYKDRKRLEVTERGIFNLGFLVRDVHALYQDLSSQGFRFLSSPVHYAPFGNPVNEVILIGPDDIPIVNLERPLLTGESYKTNYFKLNHSLLISGALEDCRKFYGGLLQLQAVRDTVLAKGAVDDILALPTGTGSAVTSFNNRDMDHLSLLCMQLSLPGQAKALRPPAVGLFQLSFQVDVLNDFTHDAMGAGYKKISGPIEYASYYGLRRAVLFDGPDHVLIEIFTSMK